MLAQVHSAPRFCSRKKQHGSKVATATLALQGCGFLDFWSLLAGHETSWSTLQQPKIPKLPVTKCSELFWAVSWWPTMPKKLKQQVLISTFHLLLIMAFLANLSPLDEWKWMIAFGAPWSTGKRVGLCVAPIAAAKTIDTRVSTVMILNPAQDIDCFTMTYWRFLDVFPPKLEWYFPDSMLSFSDIVDFVRFSCISSCGKNILQRSFNDNLRPVFSKQVLFLSPLVADFRWSWCERCLWCPWWLRSSQASALSWQLGVSPWGSGRPGSGLGCEERECGNQMYNKLWWYPQQQQHIWILMACLTTWVPLFRGEFLGRPAPPPSLVQILFYFVRNWFCLMYHPNLPPEPRQTHRNPPEPSRTCWNLPPEPTQAHRNSPEPSRTWTPEPTPAHTGTLRNHRNPTEPGGTSLQNLHQHTHRNPPEPASGTCTSTHTLESSGTFRNLPPEPFLAHTWTLRNPPEPSGTFRNLPEPSSGTYSCNPHWHTPELIWAEDPISLRCWGKKRHMEDSIYTWFLTYC